MSDPRKIFNYDNLTESRIVSSLKDKKSLYLNSISACGCLFYKIVDDELYLLLISYKDKENWPKLDDLGGRIDAQDQTVFDGISRETCEETNEQITHEYIAKRLKENEYKSFYNNSSKYYCILLEVDDSFFNDTTVFGEFEKTDQIYRTIHWFKYQEVKNNLAIRLLKNKELIEHLDGL